MSRNRHENVVLYNQEPSFFPLDKAKVVPFISWKLSSHLPELHLQYFKIYHNA